MFKKVFAKIFGSSPTTPAEPAPTPEAAPQESSKSKPSGKVNSAAEAKAAALAAKAGKGKATPAPASAPIPPTPAPAASTSKKEEPKSLTKEVAKKTEAASLTAETTAGEAAKPQAVLDWEAAAKKGIDRLGKPEDLCGISPSMSKEEIRSHLAMLYRRHNRAAASLDAALREEGELMLDAIVRCREKFLGGVSDPNK